MLSQIMLIPYCSSGDKFQFHCHVFFLCVVCGCDPVLYAFLLFALLLCLQMKWNAIPTEIELYMRHPWLKEYTNWSHLYFLLCSMWNTTFSEFSSSRKAHAPEVRYQFNIHNILNIFYVVKYVIAFQKNVCFFPENLTESPYPTTFTEKFIQQ